MGHRRARPRWRLAARLAVVATVAITLLAAWASPAAAHTSVVDSDPPNKGALDSAPERITLWFSSPVDPRSVTIAVVRDDGADIGGHRRLTEGGDTDVVEFSLPVLEPATYGIAWQSIGPDGHRATGEIVFGVGVPAGALAAVDLGVESAGDRAVDAAATAGRFIWYVALALVAGAVAVGAGLRTAVRDGGAGVGAAGAAWEVVSRIVGPAAGLALGAAVLRAVTTVSVIADGYGDTAGWRAVADAAASRTGTLWIVTVFAAAGLLATAKRLEREDPVPGRAPLIATAVAGAAAGAFSVFPGHAATGEDGWLGGWLMAAHLVAASVWIGPLAVALLLGRSAPWRSADAVARGALLARLFRMYAPVAAWSFAVLAVSGFRTMWVNLGDRLFSNAYGDTLGIKLLLVAVVVVPLGLFHDRAVRRPVGSADRVEGRPFTRTLTFETGALVAVLALAATLTGMNPDTGADGSGARREAAASPPTPPAVDPEPVSDVSQCADLVIGSANCYTDYFAAILEAEGAEAAVAEIDRLQAVDSYVAGQCHQLTHDVGRAAVALYGSIGEAFAAQASACWAGYYHGVVEATLSQWDDSQLRAELPGACSDVADPRYSADHYNCVHGMGHGLMLRFGNDLFASLGYCDALTDQWEYGSCLGGAFMQNIIGAQEGSEATLREDDLVFPCNAVEDRQKTECFKMQTSWVLWQNGYDYPAAFAVCDAVEEAYVVPCYQSMGRDISGTALLDVDGVVAGCEQGRAHLKRWCYWGAAANAVYTDRDPAKADALCAVLTGDDAVACRQARDEASGTLAS